MRTHIETGSQAGSRRGVRLTLPLNAGNMAAEIVIEQAHCERLFRVACYRAILDGLLSPTERVVAWLLPGEVRERHGSVLCLRTCRVELQGEGGTVVAQAEFPREVFAAFAGARGIRLLASQGYEAKNNTITYSVHATENGEEPFPVEIPRLAPMSVARLSARAERHGTGADGWVATFVSAEVTAGLEEMEKVSRTTGVEAAGLIHTRVGFDREHGCFVRILDRLVISQATRATSLTVVSTAASWAEFLALPPSASDGGPRAYSSAHTHLHLAAETDGCESAKGSHLLEAGEELSEKNGPCISVDDIVTHFTVFPDPLSAALIVSLFPTRREITLYAYTTLAELTPEQVYWVLPDTIEVGTKPGEERNHADSEA